MDGSKGMRVLGGKNPRPLWERFNRLQKAANLVSGGVREPRGVHRFKTWEEFNEWKMKYQVRGGSPPTTT